MIKQIKYSFLTVALLFSVQLPVYAHGGIDGKEEGQLSRMVKQSNLIFIGHVTDVRYQNETVNKRGSIPVTYVTYGIEKTIRGKPLNDSLTVRYLGGTDGKGGFLSISNVPRFQHKDRDLILMSSNGEKNCPLVNCQEGRFRILEKGVYNAHGVPVLALVKEGVIARGDRHDVFSTFRYPAPTFDDLLDNPENHKILEKLKISISEARVKFEQEAPKEILVRDVVVNHKREKDEEAQMNNDGEAIKSVEKTLPDGPISLEVFINHLSKLSEKVGGSPKTIRNIDFNQRHPVKMGGPIRPAFKVGSMDKSDENAITRENGGNPVIKQ